MSNIQAAVKVAEQIVSRIFDQRQFTAGEIEYLAREFSHDKANLEGNFERVLKLNQDACVIADTNLEDLCESSEKLSRQYFDQVSSLHTRAENLIDLEQRAKGKETEQLAEARAERHKRRQDHYEEYQSRISKLEESLKAEELELERKYRQFEQNLRNNK